jgi:hypothetical protein
MDFRVDFPAGQGQPDGEAEGIVVPAVLALEAEVSRPIFRQTGRAFSAGQGRRSLVQSCHLLAPPGRNAMDPLSTTTLNELITRFRAGDKRIRLHGALSN